MPGPTTVQRGNIPLGMIINVPLVTVPNLAANSTASQVITVQGLLPGDVITWNQQSVVAGISVENAFVSAINTLTMLWSNTTVAAVNGTAPQSFLFIVQRPEMSGGVSSLPSAVV